MRRYISFAAMVILFTPVALLGGCGLLSQPKIPPMNEYRIAPAAVQPPAGGAVCPLVLQVHGVQASAPWTTTNMLYTQTAHSIASYAYHQWAADPATMLTGAILAALDGSSLYQGVIGALTPGDADLVLSVTLTKGPIQVFSAPATAGTGGSGSSTPGSSREELALVATLTEAETNRLIASKGFSAEQNAAPNAYGGVAATNQIAGQLIGQILGWLARTNPTIKGCTAQ